MSASSQRSHLVSGSRDSSASLKEQRSSVAQESSEAEVALSVDLESGGGGSKAKSVAGKIKWERGCCRICHLSLDEDDREDECGADNGTIELGCSCKDDLAAAHRQCAETWFKIRGNRTCEICGSIAQNIPGINEAESSGTEEVPSLQPSIQTSGPPSLDRFLYFLLACIIFWFVVTLLVKYLQGRREGEG